MIYSKIYKSYYPIKTGLDIQLINEKERRIISKWLSGIKMDIECYNYNEIKKSIKCGADYAKQIKITYKGNIKDVANRIKEKRFCGEFDKYDIDFINQVIYRHKYNWFLSSFFFPIQNTKKEYEDLTGLETYVDIKNN